MRIKLTALFIALTLLLTGCSLLAGKPAGDASSYDDDLDLDNAEYPVSEFGAELISRPGIVASLSPAITEKLWDLGLVDRLEGISDHCDAPDDSMERARLGDAKNPDIDEIKRLAPHLLLTEVELDSDAYTALKQTGMEIAVIPRAGTLDEISDQYLALSKLLDGGRTGSALGERFCATLSQRIDDISNSAVSEAKNAIYLRELNFTVATGDTLENELLELIGLNNIANDKTGWTYPEDEANSEQGRAAFTSIDFIFMDEAYVTMKMLEQNSFYKGLNAVLKDYYLYIDMSAFERRGLKMFDELTRMSQYINGEIPGSASSS